MNVATRGATSSSECSSGCESGWTLYLEHSSNSSFGRNANYNNKVKTMRGQKDGGYFNEDYNNNNNNNNNNNVEVVEEEEDLSMISDASSGPPHFDHDIDEEEEEVEVVCYDGRKKTSMKLSTHHHHHQCFKGTQEFTLNDTASSPIFTSNKKSSNKGSSLKRMIDYSSQTNHFHQERSTNFHEHYGLIQPPLSAKQFRQNQWS